MSIEEPIFVVGKAGNLFSVRFKDELYLHAKEHELEKCFRLWDDPEHLMDVFDEHRTKLQSGFFEKSSCVDFMNQTEIDAADLYARVYQAADELTTISLGTIFKPLDNTTEETNPQNFPLLKGKGQEYKSWLRLYGLRTKDDLYIITGGAIKLTHRMEEARHLQFQLERMKCVRKYLSRLYREDRHKEFFSLAVKKIDDGNQHF